MGEGKREKIERKGKDGKERVQKERKGGGGENKVMKIVGGKKEKIKKEDGRIYY